MQTTIHKHFLFILTTAFAVLGSSVPVLFAQNQIPIDFGQTVTETIDISDTPSADGTHFDLYIFNTIQPNQPYVITVQAPNFAVQSALIGLDPQQQGFLIQAAYVGMPGGQVQYSGTLTQPGQYFIYVSPIGDPATTGPYTLSLGDVVQVGGGGGGNLAAFQVGACFVCGAFTDMCQPGLECLAVDATNAFHACAATQNDAFICAADGTLERGQVCNLCDPTLVSPPSCDFGLQCVAVGVNQTPACIQTQQHVEECGNLIDAALQNE